MAYFRNVKFVETVNERELNVLTSFLVQSFFETLQYCDEWRKFLRNFAVL